MKPNLTTKGTKEKDKVGREVLRKKTKSNRASDTNFFNHNKSVNLWLNQLEKNVLKKNLIT